MKQPKVDIDKQLQKIAEGHGFIKISHGEDYLEITIAEEINIHTSNNNHITT